MSVIAHGGGLAAAISRFGGLRQDWLDLSTGINPNPPDLPDIPIEIWNRLPDSDLLARVRSIAAGWYDVSADDAPLAVPGTQSFIQLLPSLVPPDRPVAILAPTYGEYAHCFRAAGFRVDLLRSPSEVQSEHGALVVVNPNNPDGRMLGRPELIGMHDMMARQGGHLHIDEAFGDMRPELSVARDAAQRSGLTVSRSFGKFFGMAGLRLGFVFADGVSLARVEAALGPWAVSGPALHIAADLMRRDRGPLVDAIRMRCAALRTVLHAADLPVVGGSDLFALVRHARAEQLADHLGQHRILVRTFDYAPEWLRIGLAPDAEADRRLAEALGGFRL